MEEFFVLDITLGDLLVTGVSGYIVYSVVIVQKRLSGFLVKSEDLFERMLGRYREHIDYLKSDDVEDWDHPKLLGQCQSS